MLWKFRVLFNVPIEIGSIVKYKDSRSTDRKGVGEVCGIIGTGENIKYEIYVLTKRLQPRMTSDDKYITRKIHSKYCKHIDISKTIVNKNNFELGDFVCYKFLTIKKYGVITGFVHPDGLDTTSYYCGYNGTDLIQCVQIDKNNLTRCRDNQRNIKKFTAHKKRLRICELGLWNEKGVNIK